MESKKSESGGNGLMMKKELAHGEANVVAKELSYEDRHIAGEIMYSAREPGLEWAFKYSAKELEKYGAKASTKMLEVALSTQGRAWTVVDPSTKLILGVSVWYPMHFSRSAALFQGAKTGFKSVLTKNFPVFHRMLTWARWKDKLREKILKGTQRVQILAYVGVLSDHQRKGYGIPPIANPSGTQLLHPLLQTCDIEGIPIFAVTSSKESVDFFKHLGFEVAEEIETKDFPQSWVVIRSKKDTIIAKQPLLKSKSIINTTFLSDVEIKNPLKLGHYSNVYKGIWLETTPVALKLVKDMESFQQEETMMRILNHPNIVKYLGVFEDKDELYLTMEFLSGGSLKDLLISHQKDLLVADLIGMCEQIAAAMRYLENMKVIHRDLALRNLLVTLGPQGKHIVKLADFGLSVKTKKTNEVVVLKETSFAYRWASPEIINKFEFSIKSDCWAFGVVMWELFNFGDTPYGNQSQEDTIESISLGKHLKIPLLMSDAMEKLTLECWDIDAQKRPSFLYLYKQLNALFAEEGKKSLFYIEPEIETATTAEESLDSSDFGYLRYSHS